MYLPHTAEYALRAMCYIAVHSLKSPIRAKDLSRETNIPVHYLSKIMRKLVNANLIISQKGRGGGFLLARPPKSINIRDILEAVGFHFNGRCVFGWSSCDNDNPCLLHHTWSTLQFSIREWAINNTLEDIRQVNLFSPKDRNI